MAENQVQVIPHTFPVSPPKRTALLSSCSLLEEQRLGHAGTAAHRRLLLVCPIVVSGLTFLAMLATGAELVAFSYLGSACDLVGTN